MRYLLLGLLLASVIGTAASALSQAVGAAAFFVAVAVGAWRAIRAGVAVSDEGIDVTGFWRDRSIPWSEVRSLSWIRPGEGGVTGVVPVSARMRLRRVSGEEHLLPLWSTGSHSADVESQLRRYALSHDVPVDELLSS